MNGIPKPQPKMPQSGLASQTVNGYQIPKLNTKALEALSSKQTKAPNALVKEDAPIEPVYSVSPVMLKHGLAAMLTSLGIGI